MNEQRNITGIIGVKYNQPCQDKRNTFKECNCCERGAPFDGPFKGSDLQCSACWLWHHQRERCEQTWGQEPSPLIIPPAVLRQEKPTIKPALAGGVGTELKRILEDLGFESSAGCGCEDKSETMDLQGIAWCKAHRDVIYGWLHEARDKLGILDVPKLAKALVKGRNFISLFDPIGSILDEAIRRAEAKITPAA